MHLSATIETHITYNGYKSVEFSILEPKTNKNGYFLATFTPTQLGG